MTKPEEHDRLAQAWDLDRERARRRSAALLADVPLRILDELERGDLDLDAPPLPEIREHFAEGRRLLMLAGAPGTGKTTAAVLTLQTNRTGKFITAPDYCQLLSSWSTVALAASIRQTRGILVLDDLGEEHSGDEEDLAKLLTARYNLASDCTTIITTNLQLPHLARYGERVLSRLEDPRHSEIIICREVLRPRREQ